MIDLQTISIVLASASVCVAALYYTFTLRYTRMNMKNTLETRQASLFTEIYEHFTDKGFWDKVNEIRMFDWVDYEDFEKKYSQYDLNKALVVGSVFEGIGVLVKRGLINIRLINDLFPLTVMSVWEKMEPIVMQSRGLKFAAWDSRYAFKGFEYLYNEVKKTHEQHLEDWDK